MHLKRSGWSLTGLAAASVLTLGSSTTESISSLHRSSFPEAILGVGVLVQLTLSLWVLLAVALALVAGPSRLLRLTTPRLLRNALFVGAAGALALAPAHAGQSLDGLQLPDRPTGTEQRHSVLPASTPVPASTPLPAPTHIVVRPGDTLWSLARASLPSDASAAAVAQTTIRWYRANRAVIGPSPHLIFPGQQLTPPPGKDHP